MRCARVRWPDLVLSDRRGSPQPPRLGDLRGPDNLFLVARWGLHRGAWLPSLAMAGGRKEGEAARVFLGSDAGKLLGAGA